MNKLTGKISFIESSETMSMVDVSVNGDVFSAVILETPYTVPYLKNGESIQILFKETEVAIAKGLSGKISMRNRIKSRIRKISESKLLTKVVLDYQSTHIVSIISTRSAHVMQLHEGDEVEWLVKTNEVSLLKE